MFDFKNLQNVLYFNWKDFFNICVPKDAKVNINKQEYENILSGIILAFVGHLVLLINTYILSSKISDIDLGLNTFGLIKKVSFVNYIPFIIILIILIKYVLDYKKSNKTNGTFNFIIMIYIFASIVFNIFAIIPWIVSIKYSLIISLLSLIALASLISGNGFMLLGCYNYAFRIDKEDEELNKDTTIHPEINVTNINIDEVGDHSFKFCPRCGYKEDANKDICSRCGNML